MIKLVFVLRRAPHLSLFEFQDYWRVKHAPLVARLAPTLGIKRYVQSHTLHEEAFAAAGAARGCKVEPYDGVAELWWESLNALLEHGTAGDRRAAARDLIEDERKFLDLPSCSLFFSHEEVIVGN